MLPEGWHCSKLGEIARITSGGTPDRSEPSYWGGSVPWVTTGEIQFNTITDTVEMITEAGLKNSSAKLFPPGTLLMAMYGQGKTRGQVAKLAIEASTNQNSAAILLNEGHDPDFYFQFLSWKYDEIRDFGHSGGVSHLNAGLLKQIVVPVAPLAEQRRIARAINTWGKAIVAVERLVANGRMQKQALMQQLLARRRRIRGPGHERRAYRLGDLFSERVEAKRNDLALLSVTRDEGVIPREEVGRKDTSNEDKSLYLRVCPGDIVYNTMRMWQGVSALSTLEGIVSPAYTVLKPSNLIDATFAAYLFKYPPTVHLFYRYSQGLVSDTWNLKFSHFRKIKLEIPALQEQIAIAKVLVAADNAIGALVSTADALRRERKNLMAELLTGKRRLSHASANSTP